MTRSQTRARFAPAPAATPLTRAMVEKALASAGELQEKLNETTQQASVAGDQVKKARGEMAGDRGGLQMAPISEKGAERANAKSSPPIPPNLKLKM